MTIPLHFLTRYAIPLIVAAIYIQDADIREQVAIFSRTERLADEALSSARKEGDGTETFDYIIVGAGPAGSIVANRLSASGQFSVLLLEAGGDPNPIREFPFASGLIGGSANDNWGFTTVKQEHGCLAMDGNCPFGMGKAVGGGSSINGGVYNRCKPKDYDHWANFTGDQSWSWQNIKDTYNSFEDYHGHYEESAGDRHGYGGEMYVGRIDYMPGQEVVEEAVREKGFPIGDLNGGEDFTVGFSKYDYNVKDGMRWGTYQAFLQPILDRPNLSIYRYAHATKIETMLMADQQTYQAVSVTYERHGVTRTARVGKEVILSAGAVGSPQLLMLSGIGPRAHLEEVGIPPIIDLPVGQYLQDHQGVLLVGEDGGFHVNTSFATDPKTPENALQYITNGTGPMSIHNFDLGWGGTGCPIMKGYMTSSQNDDTAWPEIQMDILQRYHIAQDRQEFSAYVEVMRMTNTGQITLNSSDPHEQPLIDPRIFADPEDVEKVVEGIEAVRDIFLNSQTFQRYGVQPIVGNYQPCQDLEGRDYWRCIVTHKGRVFNHPTSTCRMGPNSTVAVLDSKLKVFGTQNIRVMDTSAIPFVPSGNTNLPAMLMGARGAEIILSEI